MAGWIKLHRKLMKKAYYSKDSEKVHLWIHLLMKANHSGREEYFSGNPIHCNPGQFTCGRKQLSSETGISESKIHRILLYFEKIEQQIEQQNSSTNRLISILNWDEYQEIEQQIEQQVNSDRTASEQRVNSDRTHYKNERIKELKNYKNKLLSEIKISEFPELNVNYLEITKSFHLLIKQNLIEKDISCAGIDKVKGNAVDIIKLLIEVDKHSIEDCRTVFAFLKRDEFWKANIQSFKKLREKFPQILAKARTKTQTNQNSEMEAFKQKVYNNLTNG